MLGDSSAHMISDKIRLGNTPAESEVCSALERLATRRKHDAELNLVRNGGGSPVSPQFLPRPGPILTTACCRYRVS